VLPGRPPLALSVRAPGALRCSVPLVAWVGALAAVLTGAMALGATPALATPPLTRPGELAGWASARPPVNAAFAVLRMVVVVLAAYLLIVTVLAVVVRIVRAGRLVGAVDVVTLPLVRRIVGSAFGVGLMGAALTAVGSTVPTAVGDVRLAASTGHPPNGADDRPVGSPDLEPPTMRRVDEPQPVSVAAAETEVTIGAGDHLWSVADRELADAWGRSATEAELTPFWEQVVEVNRVRLHDPGNPDLVFPGQVVVVPPPPPAPTS